MHQDWKRIVSAGLLAVCLLLAGCGKKTTAGNAESTAGGSEELSPEREAASAEVPETAYTEPYAVIEVRDYGTITVALDPEAAPLTVANFINLAESGFYDGLTFHRIMDGFMIQGGDPTGTGYGGSDTRITGEFAANGIENPLSHVRGTISMARANDPDSASSQFFIVQADSEFLDGGYAAFGAVTEGMDVVDAICADAVPLDDNGTIAPEDQPVIVSVTIHEGAAEGAA